MDDGFWTENQCKKDQNWYIPQEEYNIKGDRQHGRKNRNKKFKCIILSIVYAIVSLLAFQISKPHVIQLWGSAWEGVEES